MAENVCRELVAGGSHMPLRDMWCLMGVGGNQDCVGVPGLGPWASEDDGLTGVALMWEGLPAAESGGKVCCSGAHGCRDEKVFDQQTDKAKPLLKEPMCHPPRTTN